MLALVLGVSWLFVLSWLSGYLVGRARRDSNGGPFPLHGGELKRGASRPVLTGVPDGRSFSPTAGDSTARAAEESTTRRTLRIVDSSRSRGEPGDQSMAVVILHARRAASRPTAPGLSGIETVDRGESGLPPRLVVCREGVST